MKDIFGKEKSNENENHFDVLLFARRNIKEVFIPLYVKRIPECSFENCSQLKCTEINEDSEIQFIGN